ncbi:SPOSA6832_00194, partial [Sporobolomyces salmonicolor]
MAPQPPEAASAEATSTLRRRHPASDLPPSSPSSTADLASAASAPSESPTWQAQLAEARLEIARKVQEQQSANGWTDDRPVGEKGDGAEGVAEGGPARRVSGASSDGEDDDLVAELLRPGATSRAAKEPPIEEDKSGEARAEEVAEEGTATEERICRICFDGEDPELGKLFSPCLLASSTPPAWNAGAKHPRTPAASTSATITVALFTSWLFLFLVFCAGFLANSLIAVVDSRSNALSGSIFDDHVLLGEGVREAVSFVGHQLEESRWSAARQLAMQAAAKGGSDDSDTTYSYVKMSQSGKRKSKKGAAEDASVFVKAAVHFTKGVSLIGLLSVFYTYVAATFVSPLGRTLFRAIRPAGGRRRVGDNPASMSQVILLIVVVLGIVRAVRQVYRGVNWLCKVALSRIEDLVIEVNA